MRTFSIVTPAKAGARRPTNSDVAGWVPAFAGMTTFLGD
jgi:hypothetical protein